MIYRKNTVAYKQISLDKSDFSIPIQIDNPIIDSFFINKITKLTRKERKIWKKRSKWNVQIFPNGTYLTLHFYFGKKEFYSFLDESKFSVGGYCKTAFYYWFDKLEAERRR